MESISNVASVGGGSAEYTAGNGININEEDVISVAEMPSTDMSGIIDPLPAIPNSGIKQENNMIWLAGKPYCALANIHVYVNPQTGNDNYDGGYGFSTAKPFASIDYALKYIPKQSSGGATGSYLIFFHISGNFTSTTVKEIVIESMSMRFYLIIDSNTIFTNYVLRFLNCSYAIIRLNANLTFNITNTSLTSTVTAINVAQSTLIYDSQNATAQDNRKIIINGNSTSRNYIRGILATASKTYNTSNYIYFEINYCNEACTAGSVSMCYYATIKGANNNNIFGVYTGSILAYNTNTATGTTIQKTGTGGRIYTGAQ